MPVETKEFSSEMKEIMGKAVAYFRTSEVPRSRAAGHPIL